MIANTFGSPTSGKSAPDKKVDGQDQEVHDQLKALHVLQARADGHAQRRETIAR